MTTWPGDALFGQDGTGGDGVGPLPGFELPLLRLPTIGPDGKIIGLDGDEDSDEDDPGDHNDPWAATDTDPEPEDATDREPAAGSGAAAFRSTGRPAANAGRVVSMGLLAEPATAGTPVADPVADQPPLPVPEPDPPDAATPDPPPPPVADAPTPPQGIPTSARFAVPVAPSAPLPPRPYARPPVVDDAGIIGLTRVSRSKVGSRLFTWFFVLVFALILVQMVVALLSV